MGRLPLLLAMLAIAVQTLVLQPHVHAAAPSDHHIASAAAHAGATAALATCAVCQTAASARVFTAPPDFVLPLLTGALTRAAAYADLSVKLTRAPAWRSRAPPHALR